jgi:hypothetical protein
MNASLSSNTGGALELFTPPQLILALPAKTVKEKLLYSLQILVNNKNTNT